MNKNVLLNTVKKLNKTQSMRKTLVAQNKLSLLLKNHFHNIARLQLIQFKMD